MAIGKNWDSGTLVSIKIARKWIPYDTILMVRLNLSLLKFDPHVTM